jgi:hypothetical protein
MNFNDGIPEQGKDEDTQKGTEPGGTMLTGISVVLPQTSHQQQPAKHGGPRQPGRLVR